MQRLCRSLKLKIDFYEISSDIKLPTQYTQDKLDKACGTNWSEPSENLTDEERAIEKVPRDDYKGTTFTDMAQVLNNWLSASNPGFTKPCNKWTVQELQNLQEIVFGHRYFIISFTVFTTSVSLRDRTW